MKRKKFILIGIIIILIVATFFLIRRYNPYAMKQRESIRYCETDTDCIIQKYNSSTCGSWAGCFNKNEKPLSDIAIGHALCDFPPTSCKCENKKCLNCIFEHCR